MPTRKPRATTGKPRKPKPAQQPIEETIEQLEIMPVKPDSNAKVTVEIDLEGLIINVLHSFFR